jgi:hypothetical protein
MIMHTAPYPSTESQTRRHVRKDHPHIKHERASSPTLSTRQMCALVAVKIVGRRERWELWHVRIGVVVEKPGGCVVVDERVVDEPVDRAALGAGLVEGVPGGQQVRMFLV